MRSNRNGMNALHARTAWATALRSKRLNIDLSVLAGTTADCYLNSSDGRSDFVIDPSISSSLSEPLPPTQIPINDGIIASCSHLTRFITAMRYHELTTTAEDSDQIGNCGQ